MEAPKSSHGRSLLKGLLLSLIATAVLLLLLEGAASFAASTLESRTAGTGRVTLQEEHHCEHDAELGWMNLANARVEDLYGPGTTYTTNGQRFRAPRDYAPEVPGGRYRVICLGDSFTMGYGVGDEDTFPALLEASSERLEVINMGLGGFGIDQDYLWYMRDGVQLETDLLLFSVIRDDFQRTLRDTFTGFHKPVLEVSDGGLEVRGVPVPTGFGPSKTSGFARELTSRLGLARLFGREPKPVRSGGEGAFPFSELAERIFAELQTTSAERGQDFAIVFLPAGVVHLQTETRLRVAVWLEELCAEMGIPFYDLSSAFRDIDPLELGDYFAHGHYSAAGNRVVAGALAEIVARDFDRN